MNNFTNAIQIHLTHLNPTKYWFFIIRTNGYKKHAAKRIIITAFTD